MGLVPIDLDPYDYDSALSPPLARQHNRTFALIHDSSCGICNDLVDHISASGYLVDEDALLEAVRHKMDASSQDGVLPVESYRSNQPMQMQTSKDKMIDDEYLHLIRRMTRYRKERDDAWEEATKLRAELLALEKETSQLRTRIWREERPSHVIGPESPSSTESTGSSEPSTNSRASSGGGVYSNRQNRDGSNERGLDQNDEVEFDPQLFAELFKGHKKQRRTAAPTKDVHVQEEGAVKDVESGQRGHKGAVGSQLPSVQHVPSKADNVSRGQATIKTPVKDTTSRTVNIGPDLTKPAAGSSLNLGNGPTPSSKIKPPPSRSITITSPKVISSPFSKGQSVPRFLPAFQTGFTIYVDASAWGIGFVCGKHWLSWPFKPDWKSEDRDNNWAEMVAVELGLRTIILAFKRSLTLDVYSDNQGVLQSLKTGFSLNVQHRDTLKEIVALMKAYEVVLNPIWIPSENNPADGPSRGRFGRKEVVFPWAAAVPPRLVRYVDAPIRPDEVDD